jgi:hypothetical protein
MDTEKMRRQLIDRITDNYSEYRASLLLKDRQELIDGAGKIADTAAIFQYMADRSYKEEELEYLLKFQNPLEVVTEHWADYELMPDALDTLIADVTDRQDDLNLFPLAKDAPAQKPESLRKFMNVDLESVLPQIMKQKTAFYQTDLNYALDAMRKGAASGDPAKQNFVLIFRESGVECLNERDMFIGGTRSFNTLQFYHTQTKEPVLTYSVELTGNGKGGLRGNLYQQDNHRLAEFAGRAASPFTDVTVTFITGKEMRLPEKEFHYEKAADLKYLHGSIKEVRNEAEDETVVQGAVKREHDRRREMPRGYFAVHLQALDEQRIQAEADRLSAALTDLKQPNSPNKTEFMAEISPYFLPLASQHDMNRLFEKVREQVGQPMYISPPDDNHKRHFVMRREERAQEQPERKLSIKAQLSAKPVPGGQPTAKNKDREVR